MIKAQFTSRNLDKGWDIVGFPSGKCGLGVASQANCNAFNSVVGGNLMQWSEDLQRRSRNTYLHQNPSRKVLERFIPDSDRVIGFWAWETDRCPDEWVDLAGHCSEIWVPSWFVARALTASGVKTPVKVIPHAVEPKPLPTKSQVPRFLVQFDGSSRVARKLPHVAIAAIIKGLDGRAGVINLKTHNFQNFPKLMGMVNALTDGLPQNIKLNIIDGWTENQDHWNVDCYVSASRGEGFGLPSVEAMASRVAVIALGYGAAQEYLDEQNGYPVPYWLVEAASCGDPYFKTGHWAEPDFEEMVVQVQRFIADWESGRLEKILNNATLTASQYSQEALIQRIREAMT
jgi:glycosyltransferase involved in cell wall biosynthesis